MKYAIILIILLFGCNPVKQVLRSPEKTLIVVDHYLQHNPINSDTIYKTVHGDSVVSILSYVDTAVVHDSITNTRVVTKYLIRQVVRTDTVFKTIIDRTLQMALQRSLVAKDVVLEQRIKDLSEMKASRNKFRLWFWLIVGAIGGGGLLWIYLKIKP